MYLLKKNKRFLLVGLFLLMTGLRGQAQLPSIHEVGPQCMPDTIAHIDPPFEMPQPQRVAIPNRTVTVKLKKGMNTQRIQQAIDGLSSQGGGHVIIPAGIWNTGRITLKSHIDLHLSAGATLKFSGNIKDYYPVVFTRDEGMELYSLGACIYANEAENIAVTGKGTITSASIDCEIYRVNAAKALDSETRVNSMKLEDRIFDGKTNEEVFLPKTIAPIRCKNILIEGVTLDQCLYWNVVLQYCENAIIRGVTVTSFGHGRTDGIDIESSKNVLVEYCSLDCSDDCYTIKSGRGKDGIRVNIPTENLVFRYCLAKRGSGGIVCGTETAGGIRNVYMYNCVFQGTDQAFRFKSRRTRGGVIQNIFVERVKADVKGPALFVDMLGSKRWMGNLASRYPEQPITPLTPEYKNIFIHDVEISHCKQLIQINALPERPLKTLFFGNVKASCDQVGYARDAQGLSLKNLSIASQDSVLTLDNCDNSTLFGVNNVTLQRPIAVDTVGEPSQHITIQQVPLKPVVYHSIQPGQVWTDTEGKPIQAHAFQVFCKDGIFYWYGEDKSRALLGSNRKFVGVRCYTSRDFYNWKDEGQIITPDSVNPLSPTHYSQKLERPHILFNKKTQKYVCWLKSQDTDGHFVIMQADRFFGPYTFVRNLRPEGYGVGDFDMYVDDKTDKAYVWFERPHWEQICAELTNDYTNTSPVYSHHFVGQTPPHTREAASHFVYQGRHYLFTSGTTGFTPNPSEVAVFDDYHGEYTNLGNPHVGDPYQHSFSSQITCVIHIPNSDLYIAMADRWQPSVTNTDIPVKVAASFEKRNANSRPNEPDFSTPQVRNKYYTLIDPGHDVMNATYIFLPIIFKDGKPTLEWKDSWKLEDYMKGKGE